MHVGVSRSILTKRGAFNIPLGVCKHGGVSNPKIKTTECHITAKMKSTNLPVGLVNNIAKPSFATIFNFC